MLVLCVLGLLALCPNKLPEVSIKIGNYLGRARSMVKAFLRQMRQEIELAPLRPDVPEEQNIDQEKE